MHSIIQDITSFIFVEDQPERADAIMVVGGSYPEAAEIAADLWKRGYAPQVFIGGGVSIKSGKFPGPRSKQEIYCKDYRTEYEFYRDVLTLNGVPSSVILGEDRSGFTRENAVFAKQTADAHGITLNKVLLVCKAFHARRCLMLYQAAFPEVEFGLIPFNGFDVSKENWWQSEYGIQRVLGELRRCGEQFTPEDIQRV